MRTNKTDDIHAGWRNHVKAMHEEFRETTGVQFSPSKMDLLYVNDTLDQTDASPRSSTDGFSWPIPSYRDFGTGSAVAELKEIVSNDEVLEWLESKLIECSNSNRYLFWTRYVPAVYEVIDDAETFIMGGTCDFLQTSRISKKQRLRHQLYFEIFKIKKRISSGANSRATLLAIYNSLDLSGFTDVYHQLSMMELKATARRKSVNTMSFIQQELFPLAIRDIPFVFIQRIASGAFDVELFAEDATKMWNSPLNQELGDGWKTSHPVHQWNASIMKSQSVKDNAIGGASSSSNSFPESLVAVYEAPWVMPSVGKAEPSTKRRSSVALPTARMGRMEGRRQSYKPSPTDRQTASDPTSHIPETQDGFAISRGVLDAMREWQIDDDQQPMMMLANSTGGIGDILEDLLHSPTQPGTRAQSPVKALREVSPLRSARKRTAPNTPQTMKKLSPRQHPKDENARPSKQNSTTSPVSHSRLDSSVSTALPSATKISSKRKRGSSGTNSPVTAKKATQVVRKDTIDSDRMNRRMSRDADAYDQLNCI